jgi:hypothetical protein
VRIAAPVAAARCSSATTAAITIRLVRDSSIWWSTSRMSNTAASSPTATIAAAISGPGLSQSASASEMATMAATSGVDSVLMPKMRSLPCSRSSCAGLS